MPQQVFKMNMVLQILKWKILNVISFTLML